MEWTDFWCIAGSGSQDAFVAFQALGQDTPLAVSFVHILMYSVYIHIKFLLTSCWRVLLLLLRRGYQRRFANASHLLKDSRSRHV